MSVVGLLAATTAPPEQFEAGPTGLFVIVLLGIGIFFLGRSMIKHMKRVPASFDPPPESPPAPDAGEPVDPVGDGHRTDRP